jgi:hypothetical protein
MAEGILQRPPQTNNTTARDAQAVGRKPMDKPIRVTIPLNQSNMRTRIEVWYEGKLNRNGGAPAGATEVKVKLPAQLCECEILLFSCDAQGNPVGDGQVYVQPPCDCKPEDAPEDAPEDLPVTDALADLFGASVPVDEVDLGDSSEVSLDRTDD